MTDLHLFARLAIALALGLLIGFERGWHERALPEGGRIAGIRTFALTGLLGGIWASLAETLGTVVLGAGFIAYAAVLIAARFRARENGSDRGITTLVAAMLTFALGAVAVIGDPRVAAAGAVAVSLLLGIKPGLHALLTRISEDEVLAVLKLLAMTVVLLPVLPDRGYGPYGALNPYEMWLMVILVAALSFAGYVAVRLAGPSRGIVLGGLAGGLVSSTAVTLTLSRLARDNRDNAPLLAAGILLAAGTMFPRTVVLAAAIAPEVAFRLIVPLGLAGLATYGAAFVLWRRRGRDGAAPAIVLRNPFEFTMALKFGVLLAAIMVLSRALQAWWGDAGLYALALISGVGDVDAVNLSLSRLAAEGGLVLAAASAGILLASLANTLFKAALGAINGGAALARPLLAGMAPALAVLVAALAWLAYSS